MEKPPEPFVEKLRAAHAAFTPGDARLVREVRTAIRMQNDLLTRVEDTGGLAEAQGFADIVDGVITVHLETLVEPHGLLALALGGYGRGELSPHSDVDLMLLVDEGVSGGDSARESAAALVRFLWDVGYQVGHSVRTATETTEAMEADIPSATAVLESRVLWGDGALRRRLTDEVVTPYLMAHRETYIEQKIREMRDRHAFYGGSPCIVEPNVKESPGGLRDMHVAQWIARARTGRRDFSELKAAGAVSPEALVDVIGAYGTIHRFRHALHRLAGKRQDVLDGATQPEAARVLGYHDDQGRIGVEDLMRVYTGAARRVHQFLDEVVTFHEVGHHRPVRRRSLHRREIASGFVAVRDGLFLARPDVFAGEGAARRMMRAFLLAQRHELAVGEEIVIAIRRHAAAEGEEIRSDPEVIQTFRSLLQGRKGVPRALRDMHRAELLDELLPEFADLTGLVRIDGYHRYTVDEHSLRTVEALESFEGDEAVAFLRDELLRVLRPDLLRLAALCHDIGKAAGPDHEAAGANRIVDVAKRLGFGEEETRILYDLLINHTLLAETADRRVLDEEIVHVAVAAGSAERLRMLMLLNVADVRAVGGEALSQWRLDQIRKLFERVRDHLETLPGRDPGSRGFEKRLADAAGPERAAAAELHASLVPPRYRLEVEPEAAAQHLDLIAQLEHKPAAARLAPGTASGELWIVSADRAARFAELCGILATCGLDVRSAEAFTRSDGVVIDIFCVSDESGEPVSDEAVARDVERRLIDLGEHPEGLDSSMRSRSRRFRVSSGRTAIPVKVRISNKVSWRHTVVDVVAADRPGLLYDLARCVAAHGLDTRFARIATRGERIVDVFYVTGPDGRVEDDEALSRLRDALLEVARS